MTGSLTLTRGIPASGKTEWAKAWVKEAPNRVRVNRDELRRMLHGVSFGLDYAQEQNITAIQQNIVKTALADGKHVVVDDTNLRARYVKEWMTYHPEVVFVDFPTPMDEAIARDKLRDNPVGEDVIRMFASKFLTKGELPPIPVLPAEVKAVIEVYEPDDNLDPAWLVDIDGTLAHIPVGGRSPYDGSRVHEDILDRAVARLVNTLGDTNHILVMTGRDEEYRTVTEKWLLDNNVRYDELHMRPLGDRRKDHVVKLELFNEHVRNRYAAQGVIDDRDRVVQMWRDNGIKCFQAQPGNF